MKFFEYPLFVYYKNEKIRFEKNKQTNRFLSLRVPMQRSVLTLSFCPCLSPQCSVKQFSISPFVFTFHFLKNEKMLTEVPNNGIVMFLKTVIIIHWLANGNI